MSAASRTFRFAVAALSTALVSTAAAQRLNLTNNETPGPGSGVVTPQTLQALRARAEALEAPSTSDDAERSRHLRRSLARLAELLLTKGHAGNDATTHLVIPGRVLAGVLLQHDAALERIAPEADALRDLDARIESIGAMLDAGVPSRADLDAALRDVLAPLAQSDAPPGASGPSAWPELPTHEGLATRWPDVGPGLDEKLRELARRAQAAESWAAYRPGVRSMARLLSDSVPPGSVRAPADVEQRRTTMLRDALDDLLAPESESRGRRGLLRLQQLAALGRVSALARALPEAPSSRAFRAAVERLVLRLPDDAGALSPQSAARLQRLEQWLLVAIERATLLDEKAILRQLRPAHRVIVEQSRLTQDRMLEALGRLADDPETINDPSVLAPINLHLEQVELLRLFVRADKKMELAAALRGDDALAPFADALLALSRRAAEDRSRDQALPALRALLTDLAELALLPDEKALRDSTDPGAVRLVQILDRERPLWRRKVNQRVAGEVVPGGEEHAARLRLAAHAASLWAAIARVRRALDPGTQPASTLAGFGGWALSRDALDALTTAAERDLQRLLSEADPPADAPLASALQAASRSLRTHAVVLLAARLEVELADVAPQPPGVARDLLRISSGSPDPRAVRLGAHADALWSVSRYAEEVRAPDSVARTTALTFAALRAEQVLAAMDR